MPINVTELCLNHKSGVSNKPLVSIYQQHDYEPEVRAAFEKWSGHVAALVGMRATASQSPAAIAPNRVVFRIGKRNADNG